ncbi:hypothetical protein QFC20_005089 [Naganishia adeliensis]|uniref:Uncharacterized protein n=1 Tax=Naganishia adeliensis TaxID=92952 RepID=A0ACC2VSM3_9TREE|nr:hypothetical protein QFC20_005089 [Naganishia adeliensis]
MFEPYSPSNPFFIDSLLKNLNKHQQMLDGRNNDEDFVSINNVSVMPRAAEELSLDAPASTMNYVQGYKVDGFNVNSINYSDDVGLLSLISIFANHQAKSSIVQNVKSFADASHNFGYDNDASRAPLRFPLHRESPEVHVARVDGQGLSLLNLLFDDLTLKLLAKYFGIDDEPEAQSSGTVNAQQAYGQGYIDRKLLNTGHYVDAGNANLRMPLPER